MGSLGVGDFLFGFGEGGLALGYLRGGIFVAGFFGFGELRLGGDAGELCGT